MTTLHKLHSNKPRNKGFTLIEILVVVVIISISVGAMMLNISFGGDEKAAEEEILRLQQLLRFAQEQSVIRSQEYGIRFYETGYRFLTLNEERDIWEDVTTDRLLRSREIPSPLELELYVEDIPVDLLVSREEEPEPEEDPEEEEKENLLSSAASNLHLANEAAPKPKIDAIKPQVYILSSSELSPPFQVRIRVPGSEIEEQLDGLVQGQYKRLEKE